jgi:choline dehydrogenase-like flavoprotein
MMRNGNRVQRGATLTCDVCIVGAGAAGITIAQALADTRHRVLLLESGGLTPDPATQDLNRGHTRGVGQPPLEQARLRYFGGTTNHWAGWSAAFPALTFEARPWVPGSGWPISREALEPWYLRAHEVCDLGAWDYGPETWGRFAEPVEGLAENGAGLALIQHSKPTRFGEKYGGALRDAKNVQVLLDSNVVELRPDAEVRTLRSAEVKTLSGNEFRVSSRIFVVACGAVENARLLLSSDGVVSSGLGNDRDLVGRYFADHPRVRPGGVLTWADASARKIEQYTVVDGVRATLSLALDAEVQRREALTDTLFFAEGPLPADDVARAHSSQQETAHFLARIGGHGGEGVLSEWWLRCEQAPNPDSRVTLSDERDALGTRRPVLSWQLLDLDRRTLVRSSRIYAEILGRAGLARVQLQPGLIGGLPEGSEWIANDWHHMGTTRMAERPERGVVDPDCRVHGIDNCYVAGASVFPSTGARNPTLTLVALALRLADHVSTRLS